jgi:hypothetical protein
MVRLMRSLLCPSRSRATSAGDVKKPDRSRLRPVEQMDGLVGRLQQDLAALFREIGLSFRRQMHVAHLARPNNELFTPFLEDELRLAFREYMRGAVELFDSLFLRFTISPDSRMTTS